MYVYAEHAGAWLPEMPGASPHVELETLRVATYNVWFDPYEAPRRRHALLDILEGESPDVIALQEVTATFLTTLLATPWVRRDFRVTHDHFDEHARYDVVMLSRVPVAGYVVHPLTSQMGRKLHVLELGARHASVYVAGVHLESMKQMTPARLTQIDECVSILARADAALWVGDFNAAPGTVEDERMRAAFRDVWPELESSPGFTRDTSRNAMLRKLKDERHQRIDRILLRGNALAPRAIRLLGTEPLAGTGGEVYPSDHFGLVADLDRC